MTLQEFTNELEHCLDELTQQKIEKELREAFSPEELAGLEYIMKTGVSKLINYLRSPQVTSNY